MAKYVTFPLNNTDYKAEDMQLWHSTRGNGVFSQETELITTFKSGMTVTISTGRAWLGFEALKGIIFGNMESVDLTLDMADGLLDRKDYVAIRYDIINNQTYLYIKKGELSNDAQPPVLERDINTAYELAIAEISIPRGTVELNQGLILDKKLDENVCGIMKDGVTSIPTATLQAQWEGWFDNTTTTGEGDWESWYNTNTALFGNEFNEWFDTAKDTLSEDVAGNLLILVNNLTAEIEDAVHAEDFIGENIEVVADIDVVLEERLEGIETDLADNTQQFNVRLEDESAQLSSELTTTTNWILNGWSGDYASGFAHTVGETIPLNYPLNAIADKLYQVVLTVDDVDTMNSGFKFTISIGDSAPFQMYQGVGATIIYSKGIKAINNGDFIITPVSEFTGVVSNISIKEVVGVILPNLQIKNSADINVLEIRPTKEILNNVFMGKNTGQHNTSGLENTIIGNGAMANSVSGFWNSALGYDALKENVNGSRSIAIGYRALQEMISGHRNIAIGTFALHRVTTGANNIGIGADSAWHTTTGENNIAIGTVSLDANTSGNSNVAIGYNALRDNLTTSYNVGIGHWALRMNTAHNNTAIGSFALSENTASGGQTAIGYQALKVSNGSNNTAIGQQVALSLKEGYDNTVVGRVGLLVLTTGSGNTVIGSSGIRYLTEGSRNTIIGNSTGATLTSGDDNILIGNGIDVPNAITSNHLNIGNLIYGDLSGRKVGVGVSDPLAHLHLGAGTTTVPIMRLNSGVLLTTPMNGAIEFVGDNLYYTTSAGVRKQIATIA